MSTISTELVANLLAAAIRYSGLAAMGPEHLPPVVEVSAQALAQKVCPDAPERCGSVAALFDTENYRIYLRDSFDLRNPMDNSFLVHEMVHVLQFWRHGGAYFDSCRNVLASERQAYSVQNNYLGEQGVDWREGGLMRFMRCPEDEAPQQGATAGKD